MDNAAESAILKGQTLDTGRVRMRSEGEYYVETLSGLCLAQRAAGCLLEPLPSDVVLLFRDDGDSSYILSVLRRSHEQESTLAFDGNVTIKVKEGRFGLDAKDIDLAAAGAMSLSSRAFSLRTLTGSVACHTFTVASSFLSGAIHRMHLAADAVDSVVGIMRQKVKSCYRRVEEVDDCRAGRIKVKAEKGWSLRAEKAEIACDRRVKIDGERIDLG